MVIRALNRSSQDLAEGIILPVWKGPLPWRKPAPRAELLSWWNSREDSQSEEQPTGGRGGGWEVIEDALVRSGMEQDESREVDCRGIPIDGKRKSREIDRDEGEARG